MRQIKSIKISISVTNLWIIGPREQCETSQGHNSHCLNKAVVAYVKFSYTCGGKGVAVGIFKQQ